MKYKNEIRIDECRYILLKRYYKKMAYKSVHKYNNNNNNR